MTSTERQRTVDALQCPVGRFLAVGESEGERLGEGSAVCVLGLDDDRLGVLHTDEGLLLRQFGEVVVDIQQPHRHHALRRLFWVLFRDKSKSMRKVS